jgi:hypothetical protein
MSDDKTHYVYVIAKVEDEKLTGPVKVGITSEPNSRLASIQTACPFRIRIAYVFEAPNREIARHIERGFHETQVKAHLHGEWFDYHPVQAIQLLCLMYRAAMHVNIGPDQQETIDQYLEACGVISAENRFKLPPPSPEVLQ